MDLTTDETRRALLEAGFSASSQRDGEGYVHTFTAPPNPLLQEAEYALAGLRWRREGDEMVTEADYRREQEAEHQRLNDLFLLSTHGYPADLAERIVDEAERAGVPVALLHELAQTTGVAEKPSADVGRPDVSGPTTKKRGRGASKTRRQMAKASRRRNRRR